MEMKHRGRSFLMALVLVGLFAAALPVAADRDNGPPDRAGRASDEDRTDRLCQVDSFRVLADADVMMGTAVGGPDNGFPVTVISEPGSGLALNTTVQVPSSYIPFVPTMANGTPVGSWNSPVPGSQSAIFFVRQLLHANDLFSADRGGIILTSHPDSVALSGCE
jgi:hypothetical protein